MIIYKKSYSKNKTDANTPANSPMEWFESRFTVKIIKKKVVSLIASNQHGNFWLQVTSGINSLM